MRYRWTLESERTRVSAEYSRTRNHHERIKLAAQYDELAELDRMGAF